MTEPRWLTGHSGIQLQIYQVPRMNYISKNPKCRECGVSMTKHESRLQKLNPKGTRYHCVPCRKIRYIKKEIKS